jgi:hypothetical protein
MTTNTFRFTIPKPEGKRTVRKCRNKMENINMVFKKLGVGCGQDSSRSGFESQF